MTDRYVLARSLVGFGSHNEAAARAGAGTISLIEAQAMGLSQEQFAEIAESGTTDTTQDGIHDPDNKHTHVGVRMPGAAKPPVDVRPIYGYLDGSMVGWVQAQIVPSNETQERGALTQFDVQWIGQRTLPYGLKQTFEKEAEAKKFVANGEPLKWYRPDSPDPWESMSNEQREQAAQCLADDLLEADGESDKFERCVKKVKAQNRSEGRSEKGTKGGKGNPWAICHASTGESMGYGFEDWLDDIDVNLPEGIGMEDLGDETHFTDSISGDTFAVASMEADTPVLRVLSHVNLGESVPETLIGARVMEAVQYLTDLHKRLSRTRDFV